jgi:hypothetical protein
MSGMSGRDRFSHVQNYHNFRQPMLSVSSKRGENVNLFRPSEDNPFADNISKYYKEQDEHKETKQKNRDFSFSNFERSRENEASLRFSKTMKSEFDGRQR